MTTKPKRPRDTNQLAKLIADIATGQADEPEMSTAAEVSEKARLAGIKGGAARAIKLSKERKASIARDAAAARWKREG